MATAVTTRIPAPVDERAGPRHAHRRWVVPTCTVAVVVLYGLSAVLSTHDPNASDFHRRQAEALVEGHLDIRPVPDALRSLPDPYDPGANMDLRRAGLQDLAFRDGRLYSAHGLTVPLLLVPSVAVFGTAPPNWVITLVGGWIGIVAAAAVLVHLRRRCIPTLPDRWLGTAVLAVGLCGPMWTLMSVGNGYEASVAVAFATSMVGAALLLRGVDGRDPIGRWSVAAGSSSFGFAVGARPTMVVLAIGLVVVGVAVLRRVRADATGHARRRAAGDLAALLLPFAAVVTGLMAANLARFGSPVEFGNGFQLSVWNMRTYPIGRISHLAPNLADYLSAAPGLLGRFPWVRFRDVVGGVRTDRHTAEPLVGLAFLAPVIPVGFSCLAAGFREMRRRAPALAVQAVTATAIGAAALVAVSFPFNTAAQRYAADAAPMLLLAACAGWGWVRSRSAELRQRWILDVTWSTALVVGIAVTALVQIPT